MGRRLRQRTREEKKAQIRAVVSRAICVVALTLMLASLAFPETSLSLAILACITVGIAGAIWFS